MTTLEGANGSNRRTSSPGRAGEPSSPWIAELAGRTLTDRDFESFRGLIRRLSGINLSPEKKSLLMGRLSKRLRDLGLTSYADYYRHVVESGDAGEVVRMLDCICTNETQFFREPGQFDFVGETLCPAWRAEAEAGRRAKRITVWSAACSTGEEPYSMAMTLLHHLPPESGWTHEILATDLSTKVLATAIEGLWPIEKAAQIPSCYLGRFMLRGTGTRTGTMAAGPEVRSVVRFERSNLVSDDYPGRERFDVILCRNVLIYFDGPTKARVLGRVASRLAPGGHLFLGHAESVHGMEGRLKRAFPAVYSLPDVSSANASRRSPA